LLSKFNGKGFAERIHLVGNAILFQTNGRCGLLADRRDGDVARYECKTAPDQGLPVVEKIERRREMSRWGHRGLTREDGREPVVETVEQHREAPQWRADRRHQERAFNRRAVATMA
jgi:hypothetical protein